MELLQHGFDHAVVEFLIFFIGPVGQGSDEAAGAGNIRFESNVRNRFNEVEVIHKVVIGVDGDFLAVNFPYGGSKCLALFLGLQFQPFFNTFDKTLINFKCFKFAGLRVFVFPHLIGSKVFGIDPDDHIHIVHHIFSNGIGLIHISIEHFSHDAFPVEPLCRLEVLQVFDAIVGIRYIIENDSFERFINIIGEHALAFICLGAFKQQLTCPAQIPLTESLLAEALCNIRVLIEHVDHFRQRFDAFFASHLACGQLHSFNRCQFFRAGKTTQDRRHRCCIVQIGILM